MSESADGPETVITVDQYGKLFPSMSITALSGFRILTTKEALNYLKHYKELLKQGLRAYTDQYGPLTIDSAKVGVTGTGQPSLGRGEGGMC